MFSNLLKLGFLTVLLAFSLSFTVHSVFAFDVTFNNPTHQDLIDYSVSTGTSNSPGDFYSVPNWQSTQSTVYSIKFCSDVGASYVSHAQTLTYFSGQFLALNFNQSAYESSVYASPFDQIVCSFPDPVQGCTDSDSINYDPLAGVDDGSCQICSGGNVSGCSESSCSQYGQWDGTQCLPNQIGCSDPIAINYNPLANVGNNAQYCEYCSPNSNPLNCFNQSDCTTLGGFDWDTQTNECYDPLAGSNADITVVSQDITENIDNFASADFSTLFEQSCVSYSTTGACLNYNTHIHQPTAFAMIRYASFLFLGILFMTFALYKTVCAVFRHYTKKK